MTNVLPALEQGVTAVTANKRLARTLLLAFNRTQLARGARAWRTPPVLAWHAWLEKLWAEAVHAGADAATHVLITPAQKVALWRSIAMENAIAPLPGDNASLAELAMDSWGRCQDWRVSDEDLDRSADSVETFTFARWAGEYRKRCAQLGLLDPDMLSATVAAGLQRGTIKSPGAIQVVGFVEWTPAQREIVRVLASLGCEIREEPVPRVSGRQVHTVACHDEVEELALAARWARLKREQESQASIAVIVPDLAARRSQVRRVFLDVFAPDWRSRPGDVTPVSFSLGPPLTAVGLVHAALLILRMLSGSLDYRDFGQLLRSPYLGGYRVERGARANLDLVCRERQGTQCRVADIAAGAGSDATPLLASCLQQINGIASSLPRAQPPSRWAATFEAALRACGWPGDRTLGSDEYQALMAWREQLSQLRSCDRISGELGCDSCLDLLSGTVGRVIFQPSGATAAVQVMGTLEAVGQQFDALWVCGLSSEAWPPASSPDPLLPLALQRRLQMPAASSAAARERAERLLRGIESSASEVVLSWPGFRGDEPVAPSPLIGQLPRIDAGLLRRWDGETQREALLRARRTELVVDDVPPALDPRRLPLRRGGVTLLERQSRCPARAFLEFRLGARELRAPVTGLDTATRGTMVHTILQRLFRRISDQQQLRQLDEGEQARILEELIRQDLAKLAVNAGPIVRALLNEERARLAALLSALLRLERERQPFRVIATEQVLADFDAPESLRALQLTLRIDRVDESADGRRLLIDYKTGRRLASLGEIHGDRLRSPQLPTYAVATACDAVAFLQVSRGSIGWRGVGQGEWGVDGILSAAELTKDPDQEWEALRAAWRRAVDRLAGEFLRGDFRVDRRHLEDALGQWAMATRIHELEDIDPGPR